MIGFGISLTGVKELDAMLAGLEPKLAKKYIRSSIRKSLKPIAAEAKALAPVDTGATREAVKVKPGKSNRKKIQLQVAVGEGWFTGDEFYAGFNLLGTKRQPPNPWLQEAHDRLSDSAYKQFLSEIGKAIDQEAR